MCAHGRVHLHECSAQRTQGACRRATRTGPCSGAPRKNGRGSSQHSRVHMLCGPLSSLLSAHRRPPPLSAVCVVRWQLACECCLRSNFEDVEGGGDFLLLHAHVHVHMCVSGVILRREPTSPNLTCSCVARPGRRLLASTPRPRLLRGVIAHHVFIEAATVT